ncbi:MAG: hypothetical protein ACT4P6_00200 [Gemmatimonadaceae bacterium]
MRSNNRWHSALALVVTTVLTACSDVAPDDRPNAATARRGVDAELIVSDIAPTAGADVVLLVRVRLGSDVQPIASFTARVAYDTTRLRLLGEQQLEDAATRMINPAAGDARVAGFTTDGFADGQLFALQFTALQPDGLTTVQLAFDELHSVDGRDLQNVVRVLPTLVPRSLR